MPGYEYKKQTSSDETREVSRCATKRKRMVRGSRVCVQVPPTELSPCWSLAMEGCGDCVGCQRYIHVHELKFGIRCAARLPLKSAQSQESK